MINIVPNEATQKQNYNMIQYLARVIMQSFSLTSALNPCIQNRLQLANQQGG
mgnify:CR=1 FL=1